MSAQVTTVSSEELARRIASVALDKKARDVGRKPHQNLTLGASCACSEIVKVSLTFASE